VLGGDPTTTRHVTGPFADDRALDASTVLGRLSGSKNDP